MSHCKLEKSGGFQHPSLTMLADPQEKKRERNMYQELHDLVHDNQGNLGDIVDVVSEFIEKNYKPNNEK